MIEIKKILMIVIILFVLTGCTVKNVKSMSIDDIINTIYEENNLSNTNNKGYRYYLPKGFSVYKNNLYNQTLISNSNKYYLNIDIVAYYNKTNMEHTKSSNPYYYKTFNFNNINGYIEINTKNDYFFIEMMYNYAIIEVVVKEDSINYATINMMNILKSIKYNDNVISNEIGENLLTQKETKFELEKPKTEIDTKNFLEYMEEYGTYESSNMPKDTDVIGE